MSAIKSVIAESQSNAQVGKVTQPTPRLGLFNRKAKLAAWQNQLNTQYQDRQNEYNSPAQQMARYRDAGLNPHLMYGQGSPGNQSSVQQATGYEPRGILETALNVIGVINQTAMMASQRAAIDANIEKTKAQTATESIKQSVMSANPILRSDFLEATIERMQAEAKLKGVEAKLMTQTQWVSDNGSFQITSRMQEKIDTEINLLKQRFNLGSLDTNIKAEILNSKEMQNAILEVQKKFMTEFELTPETWTQFVKIFLTKLF